MDIFKDDADRLLFLGILERETRIAGARVLFGTLMGNHFHFVIRVGDVELSVVMQRVLCRYARAFNARHSRSGHLFQARFKAKLCVDEGYLMNLFRYVHINPVRDGFVDSPDKWPWSSYHQLMGPIHSTLIAAEEALSLLARDPTEARVRLRTLLGAPDDGFEPVYDAEFETREPREVIRRRKPRGRLESVMKPPRGKGRPRELTRARREFALEAAREGYPNSEIARALGVHPCAVSRYLSEGGPF